MPTPFSLLRAVVFGSVLLLSTGLKAEDANPPYIARGLENLTVPVGTATSKVNLKKTFALTNVSQQVVRFATTMGNIDVELRPDVAPLTVTNFLSYANSGAYAQTFIHRSVANFIIQGGGYDYQNNQVVTVPENAPVQNEFKLSNTRGTIAMAKLGNDPDSATNQWFFNESDDNASNLDNQNGGFTVFGKVIGNGLNIVDAIAALTTVNAGSPFDELPVVNYSSSAAITSENLVFVNSVTTLPLLSPADGSPGLLKITATSSNPGLVTPTVTGKKLLLTYSPGVTGTATINVKAKNTAKSKSKTSFLVTVQ